MSVTIRDVARLAGVSASTVSRVLNGKGAISEETKKRIFDAMDELRYVPNELCAQLCQRRPRAIALVIDVADPAAYSNDFFNNTVFGLETVAHKRDYSLMVTNGSRASGGVSGVERLILGKKVDGVVFPHLAGEPGVHTQGGGAAFPLRHPGPGGGRRRGDKLAGYKQHPRRHRRAAPCV